MPDPADWHDKAWAVLFRRSKSTARGAERKSHLCWSDPAKHWGPALFVTKKAAEAYIASRFAWINDPGQNHARHRMPKPVRVRASVSVVQNGQKSEALADLPAWRPIATAPKCGTIWLALWEDSGPVVGCWHRGAWRTRDKGYPLRPTHWLPLPAINEGRDDY